MVCIFSHSQIETSTEDVADWLRAWKVPFLLINGSDIDSSGGPLILVSNAGIRDHLVIDEVTLRTNEIKVVWYRRWAYRNAYRSVGLFRDHKHSITFNIYSTFLHIYHELQGVSHFLFSRLASAKWLSNPSITSVNKLQALKLAAEVGLDIPETIATTSLEEMRRFAAKHGEIITKPISEILLCNFNEKLHGSYTSSVPEEFLENEVWQGAFPSLFQEKLRKKYEIRIFYLDGKCYSMAMFTQNNEMTQTDFRKYSYDRPSRTVPYQLEPQVEDKLGSLMKALRLDTGSIDMVRTVDGRNVFLEVNPVGQFGMVSEPCNYFLEEKVARALVDRLYEGNQPTNEILR
jgi:ATP-GRASP peptide maturase of grasp-with-spasm system